MDWARDVYPCNAPRALRHLPARAAFTLSARNGTVLNLTPRRIEHRIPQRRRYRRRCCLPRP